MEVLTTYPKAVFSSSILVQIGEIGRRRQVAGLRAPLRSVDGGGATKSVREEAWWMRLVLVNPTRVDLRTETGYTGRLMVVAMSLVMASNGNRWRCGVGD